MPLLTYAYGAVAIGVVALLIWIAVLSGKVDRLEVWQDDMVAVVKEASNNPDTTKRNAMEQVRSLGRSVDSLQRGIDAQNKAVEAAVKARDDALALAKQERQRRQSAIDRSRKAADVLEDTGKTPADDPDAAMREAQDLAYEEGI